MPHLAQPLQHNTTSCFAAGTFVHTKEGLKPIQDIRVGDYVLSKQESGTGEIAYKRVVNVFSFDNKPVWYVEYIALPGRYADDPGVEVLIATPNHPFWVVGKEEYSSHGSYCEFFETQIWKSLEQLERNDVVLLNNGELASIAKTAQIFKTHRENIGWHQAQYLGGSLDFDGHLVHFDKDLVKAEITFMATSSLNDLEDDNGDYIPFMAQVYNIEVEDFHTYFVGEMGVWVRDSSGMNTSLTQ